MPGPRKSCWHDPSMVDDHRLEAWLEPAKKFRHEGSVAALGLGELIIAYYDQPTMQLVVLSDVAWIVLVHSNT